MRRSDFIYELPQELIACYPSPVRGEDRLLCLEGATGSLEDCLFAELPQKLRRGDLLVLNDTRVIPARLLGCKQSGGRVELLVERIVGKHRVWGHLRTNRACKTGTRLTFEGEIAAEVLARKEGLYEVRFVDERPVHELLESWGRIPLPPYLGRAAQAQDCERYQTVYARCPGAVAAPAAGLHFDQAMLSGLEKEGVELAYVTLHVGAGTFQPVRTEELHRHRMHSEWTRVDETVCRQVRTARARGGRIVAVGTTVVRALESVASQGEPVPYTGETRLFIWPGYRFRVVDALITNFHLPGSTLLMLVCALGGYAPVMGAYRHALEKGYRFFSYGDAMWVAKGGCDAL